MRGRRPRSSVGNKLLIALLALATTSLLLPAIASARTRGCGTSCAVSSDGMDYRVTSVRVFNSATLDEPVTAVGFQIANRSHHAHVFAPFPGGFTAVTKPGGIVQFPDGYIGAASDEPDCYDPHALDPGVGTDPDSFRVRPGEVLTRLREMCLVLPGGEKLSSVDFADNDAYDNAVVKITRFDFLPPLPDPCRLPGSAQRAAELDGLLGDEHLSSKLLGTIRGERTCARSRPVQPQPPCPYEQVYGPCPVVPPPPSIRVYIGFIRPPRPTHQAAVAERATVAQIVGFPGGELINSSQYRSYLGSKYFVIASFARRYRGYTVYGEVEFDGSICPPGDSLGVATAAKGLYSELGSRPPVRLHAVVPHHRWPPLGQCPTDPGRVLQVTHARPLY